MKDVAVKHSRQGGDRGHRPFRIPVAFGIPGSNAGVEHSVIECKEQSDLVIKLVVIALGNKLSELIPENWE